MLSACGDGPSGAEEPGSTATEAPAASPDAGTGAPADAEGERRGRAGDEASARPAPGGDGAREEGGEEPPVEPDEAADERAASAAELAYRAYIEAINERDGETLCSLLPAGAERTLKTPVSRGDCARRISESIGYRDPRGYPVWEETFLSGIEGSRVTGDLDQAQLSGLIVTYFADRSEPSIESDIAYLELAGGDWRLAKPSGALYRAIGRPQLPASIITPP